MRLLKTVYIKPSLLGPGIIQTINSEVKNKFLGSCTSEHGYITHISNIVILDTRLEYSLADVSVRVSCSVTTAKPYVGERIRCTVSSQIPQGTMLVVDLYDHTEGSAHASYRVFVPVAYSVNEDGNSISTAKEGSTVEVEILAVKYDKQQFNCIAKYI
jgi:DNA-directed RNA polymerase subunit E'/Rpb7